MGAVLKAGTGAQGRAAATAFQKLTACSGDGAHKRAVQRQGHLGTPADTVLCGLSVAVLRWGFRGPA